MCSLLQRWWSTSEENIARHRWNCDTCNYPCPINCHIRQTYKQTGVHSPLPLSSASLPWSKEKKFSLENATFGNHLNLSTCAWAPQVTGTASRLEFPSSQVLNWCFSTERPLPALLELLNVHFIHNNNNHNFYISHKSLSGVHYVDHWYVPPLVVPYLFPISFPSFASFSSWLRSDTFNCLDHFGWWSPIGKIGYASPLPLLLQCLLPSSTSSLQFSSLLPANAFVSF